MLPDGNHKRRLKTMFYWTLLYKQEDKMQFIIKGLSKIVTADRCSGRNGHITEPTWMCRVVPYYRVLWVKSQGKQFP